MRFYLVLIDTDADLFRFGGLCFGQRHYNEAMLVLGGDLRGIASDRQLNAADKLASSTLAAVERLWLNAFRMTPFFARNG